MFPCAWQMRPVVKSFSALAWWPKEITQDNKFLESIDCQNTGFQSQEISQEDAYNDLESIPAVNASWLKWFQFLNMKIQTGKLVRQWVSVLAV